MQIVKNLAVSNKKIPNTSYSFAVRNPAEKLFSYTKIDFYNIFNLIIVQFSQLLALDIWSDTTQFDN